MSLRPRGRMKEGGENFISKIVAGVSVLSRTPAPGDDKEKSILLDEVLVIDTNRS